MAERGKVLAVANEKGGVSKSTLITNLTVGIAKYISAQRGHKTRALLIDNDPQSGSTVALGYEDIIPEQSMYQVYYSNIKVGEQPLSVADITIPVQRVDEAGQVIDDEGIDLAPADIKMSTLEMDLTGAMAGEATLRNAIRKARKQYPFILMDTSPSLGQLTINALTAADGVIIPVQTSKLGLRGLRYLLDTIIMVQNKLNPDLQIVAVIPTMVKTNRKVSDSVLDYLSGPDILELYPELEGKVTHSMMNYREVYGKVQVDGQSVYHAHAGQDISREELATAIKEFEQITKEVLERCQTL